MTTPSQHADVFCSSLRSTATLTGHIDGSNSNSNSNIANANALAAHRPTEGQLRWAQFHHKRNARAVKERVEQMWLHPATWQDVPGALPDDGDNDLHENNDSDRPTVSAGRRALLKVSQRQWQQRKQHLETHGFAWDDNNDNTTQVMADESVVSASFEGADALAEIFAEEHFRNNKRKRRRQKRRMASEKDRVRRFEAAFYTLLHALAEHEQTSKSAETTIVATKRWERPGHHGTIHNTDFLDLKWGGVLPNKSHVSSSNYNNSTAPWMATPDRGASWLVHLPSKSSSLGARNRNPSQMSSHCNDAAVPHPISDEVRQQLSVVARRYWKSNSGKDGSAPSSNQSKSQQQQENRTIENDDDVATLVDQLLEQHVTDENSVKNLLARFESMSPSSPSNANAKPTGEPSPAAALTTTADLVLRFEQQQQLQRNAQQQQPTDRDGFVQQLVAQMDAACQRERCVSADGKLHKAAFARLLRRYIQQWQQQTEQTVSSPRGKDPKNEPSASLVQTLLEKFESNDAQVETVVTSEGTLDTIAFRRLVERYLDQAAVAALNDKHLSRHQTSASALSDPEAVLQALTQAAPKQVGEASGFFGRIRNVRDKVNRYRLGTGTSTVTIDEQADAVAVAVEAAATDTSERAVETLGKDAAGAVVSNRVDEFFESLHLRYTMSDQQAGVKEYYAFRQAQEQRNNHDDGSSLSSFRAIPTGLRRVVERVRGTQQLPLRKEDCDHERGSDTSEHKRMESLDDCYAEDHQHHKNYSYETESGVLSSSHGGDRSNTSFSPDNVKGLQAALLSGIIGAGDHPVIDTDENSDGRGAGMPADMVASLMLSPTILTKRHQQAIRAVELRKWDQVMYLLSANPWLAEMADVATNQYILHKLAFFGAGEHDQGNCMTGEKAVDRQPAAPDKLNVECMRMFPSAVHKFDKDGDLPLHMAAASANFAIIKLLGDRFPSGASVRNDDGMLPLHLAILAIASRAAEGVYDGTAGREIVECLVRYFPGSLAVVDNEGNLPVHTAATVLRGRIGASIVYYLIEEAGRQTSGPSELRFRTKRSLEEIETESSIVTEATDPPTGFSNQSDDTTNCLLVRNELNDTPLAAAIYSGAGWEVIEALTCKDTAVQTVDAEANNALHLLVSEQYQDPGAALAIMKLAPETATMRNARGMLPIEIACMQCPTRELILALVLVDLPIDLDQTNDAQVRDGYGASWWYIACECDDFFSDVVDEVVSLCSYEQVKAMSFWTYGSTNALIACATPQSRTIIFNVLRFAGRYEFIKDTPVYEDVDVGLEEYHVLDYGPPDDPLLEGRSAVLRCFSSESSFWNEVAVLQDLEIDRYFEEITPFTLDEDHQNYPLPKIGFQRFYIAIERPDLTLSGVVRGMLGNQDCRNDINVRQRYTIKVFSVLRLVAKALHRLHGQGFVHADLCLENCGRFEDDWKLSDILGAQRVGLPVEVERLSSSAPPESIEERNGVATFRKDLVAHPTLDSWAFGKVAFEVIVGDTLIEFDVSHPIETDHKSLANLLHWSDSDVQQACRVMGRVGVTDAGISMVAECLAPKADDRPTMDEILNHPVWEMLRR